MAADRETPRNFHEIRKVKPQAKGRNLNERKDFSNLIAMLVKIEKQKERKKK